MTTPKVPILDCGETGSGNAACTAAGAGPAKGEAARYRAFFVTLGSVPEGAAEWRAAFAGLVTLRYVDAWAESGFSGASLDAERQAVESAIRAVPGDMPEHGLLHRQSRRAARTEGNLTCSRPS